MFLTENALKVLQKRYLAKDENGNIIETVEDMFRRVARHVAQADKIYSPDADVEAVEEEFYNLMVNLEFMPNSPTLMNAGRPLGQLSACFVLPVPDSMEGIFDAVKHAALIHKSGGGTGFSFSRLRPKGSAVKSTGGVASGPVSFMKVFNAATEAVKQGGTRRGANMGILRVDHPDILEFIDCKKNNSDITNFNISVGITEAFMRAVERGEDYDLIDPRTGKPAGRLNAREVFDKIVENAWHNGEPGIIFLDRLNRDNVLIELGEIESTNPCGEQPLLPYESCNLGSINLSRMVEEVDGKYVVNYDKLGRVVDLAVHFLDNVIDVNKYPLPQIEEMTKGSRKIGLGVMGFADMLFKLGIPYNSDEAVELARQVMKFIQERSKEMSARLAEVRGVFPFFEKSTLRHKGLRLRNATTTTIAPTGTISIICGTTSGIEPLFAISFVRNVMDNDQLVEVHPYFKEVAIKRGFYSDQLMRKIAARGSIQGMEEIPEDVRRVFVTAHDVSPEYHVRMQAAFQEYTDNAVSKTVNFPNSATVEDVRKVYWLAYELGCKGVTIYRDGSREGQVLSVKPKEDKPLEEKPIEDKPKIDKKDEKKDKTGSLTEKIYSRIKEQAENKQPKITPRPRPDVTMGFTEKVRIGCGNLYITVNYDDQGICEVFTNLGRAGGCPSQSEATSRLISIALRSGMDVDTIIEQLKGIRCHSTLRQKGLKVLSCPDAIGRVLEKVVKLRLNNNLEAEELDIGSPDMVDKHSCLANCSLCSLKDVCNNPYKENGGIPLSDSDSSVDLPAGSLENSGKLQKKGQKCPECGATMEHDGGCVVCRSCGYSKCG
ncbi:ribonucleoside-diphosphate reductase alpha chain [Caldicoprobacter guelmensis]|uniref:vitamin B12-dependent ribonucleotide reductase n=1 Tax=Caldicoprobacter guelmensis TaxID=1170224 RepID=UPI001958104A|nr:vitamin B12-dependent ribonucleotide reductase [Caldicoprobacter guelmensis]MBM7581687.1 ribonucleoside-diphosphate reductase alpha chain [Caldicoprobacter guelmensis]